MIVDKIIYLCYNMFEVKGRKKLPCRMRKNYLKEKML